MRKCQYSGHMCVDVGGLFPGGYLHQVFLEDKLGILRNSKKAGVP